MRVGDLVKVSLNPHHKAKTNPYWKLMTDLYPDERVGIIVGGIPKSNPPMVKILTGDGILRYPANSLEVINEGR